MKPVPFSPTAERLLKSKNASSLWTACASALLLSAGVLVAQQNFDKVQIKTTKVAGSVYMLEGSGGNIGVLIGEDGIILVDDQFGPLSEKTAPNYANLECFQKNRDQITPIWSTYF